MDNIIELHNTIDYDKKFTNSWELSDYEILTDEGYVGIEYLHQTIKYDVYELSTMSNKILKCADNHIVFLSNMEEIFVKDLKHGDLIITSDNDGVPIIDTVLSVNKLGYKDYMYDFQLEDNSNRRYYTNDILSHNTELAKRLAEHLFESQDSLIRIDMSEYMEKFAVSRLIGSPPGYVGHEEGGQLTEKIRRKPYSVVLFDEIEKAHPEVFNLLLQVLDDGQLTDSMGRKISFKNCVIMMTSNTGSRKLSDFGTGVGFSTSSANKETRMLNEKSVIDKELKKTFSPEFINRIDEIIHFNTLEKEDLKKIVNIEIDKVKNRVIEIGYELELTPAALDIITEKGFDSKYGARPMKRAIQKYVEDVLTEEIINSSPKEGSKLKLDWSVDKEEMVVEIETKRKKK